MIVGESKSWLSTWKLVTCVVPPAVPSLTHSDDTVPLGSVALGVDSMNASFPSNAIGSEMVPSNVAIAVVPAVVPSLTQSVSVAPPVTKKTSSPTVVNSLGAWANRPGARTLTIVVPADVPSVFQSSVPVPSSAAKTMVLPITANASGMLLKIALPWGWEWKLATALVPAAVPLLDQSALEPAAVATEK